MIKKKKYKEYNIYYPEKEIFYEELGKRIINTFLLQARMATIK